MHSSKHLVDPELRAALEQHPGAVLTPDRLPAIRAGFARAIAASRCTGDAAVALEQRHIPGPEACVRVLIYSPRAPKAGRPALLHMHGGGFVLGAPEMNDQRNRYLAAKLDCVVVSVDYRLAPEAPFPAALEDCYAALKWLHVNAAALGIDTSRIAVGGDSAGGCLAASLALLVRDRGELRLAFQLLVYPALDDRDDSVDPHPYCGEYLWSRASNAAAWAALLDGSTASRDFIAAYAAPVRAADLAGLPPAYIGVGALDLYLEQDLEYARRLLRAGVAVQLCVYPGAYHGFDMVADASVSKMLLRDCCDALTRAFRDAA